MCYRKDSLLVESDGNKTGWNRRLKESELQRKKYFTKNLNLTINKKKVESCINSWIKDKDLSQNVASDIHQIELFQINNLEFLQDYEKKINEIKMDIIKSCDENESTIEYHYLWITFNSSGMVVSVGRTSFEKTGIGCGDLFYKYDIYGNGSQKIILQALTEIDENIKKTLNELNKKLNDYNYFAFIVPIKSKVIKNVSELERCLGDYLIENDIEIMNFYSHRFK